MAKGSSIVATAFPPGTLAGPRRDGRPARLLPWMTWATSNRRLAGRKLGRAGPAQSKRASRAVLGGQALRFAIAVTAALLLSTAISAAARTPQARYHRCRGGHVGVRGAAGGSLSVTSLGVIRMSCARAAAAVRASRYEATPGGPLFTSPGFSCRGPVGPPPPGAKPRYYQCDRARQRFEFVVPGFS